MKTRKLDAIGETETSAGGPGQLFTRTCSNIRTAILIIGKGKIAGYIPLHEMFSKLGYKYCRSILKAHLETGCNYLSKVGTKKSALVAYPATNLKTFGEGVSLTEEQIDEAEKYLGNVYHGV